MRYAIAPTANITNVRQAPDKTSADGTVEHGKVHIQTNAPVLAFAQDGSFRTLEQNDLRVSPATFANWRGLVTAEFDALDAKEQAAAGGLLGFMQSWLRDPQRGISTIEVRTKGSGRKATAKSADEIAAAMLSIGV